MYVMEYLLYHLRPYGIDSQVRFEKTNNDQTQKNTVDLTTSKKHEDSNSRDVNQKDEKGSQEGHNKLEATEKSTDALKTQESTKTDVDKSVTNSNVSAKEIENVKNAIENNVRE